MPLAISRVDQAVRSSAIKDIEEALDRALSAQQYGEIHVTIKPGKITVAGTVSSQYDLGSASVR